MTMVGCTLEAIARQEAEHGQLEKSLEDQHVSIQLFAKVYTRLVHTLIKVAIFDINFHTVKVQLLL